MFTFVSIIYPFHRGKQFLKSVCLFASIRSARDELMEKCHYECSRGLFVCTRETLFTSVDSIFPETAISKSRQPKFEARAEKERIV